MIEKTCTWSAGKTARGALVSLVFLLFAESASAQTGAGPWLRSASGPGASVGTAAATDAFGNTYIAGHYSGSLTLGSRTLPDTGGQTKAFVAKLNALGEWLWAVHAGGAGGSNVEAAAVAVDDAGNAYVTGRFQGTVDFGQSTIVYVPPNVAGAEDLLYDVFIAKIDPVGNWVWVREPGSSNPLTVGRGTSIAVRTRRPAASDAGGVDVVVGGKFAFSFEFPNIPPLSSGNNSMQAFIIKLDEAGNWIWAKSGGGDLNDDMTGGVAIDGDGDVYATGFFSPGTVGASLFGSPATPPRVPGNIEFITTFVVKLKGVNGGFQWLQTISPRGSVTDLGLARFPGIFYSAAAGVGLAVNAGGAVYVTGLFSSHDLTFSNWNVADPLGLLVQDRPSFDDDVFVAKLTTNGSWVWARWAGGNSNSYPTGIAVDSLGAVYLAGDVERVGSIRFGGSSLSIGSSTRQAFSAKLDASGSWQWARPLEEGACTTSAKSAGSLAVDNTGDVAISGSRNPSCMSFGGVSFPTSVPSAFAVKLDALGNARTTSFNPFTIGQEIPRPAGAIAQRPEIQILARDRPDNDETNSFFWSNVEQRLYAVRPVTAVLRWFVSPSSSDPRRIERIGTNIFPAPGAMQLHIAGAPVDLEPAGIPVRYASLLYTENLATDLTRRFETPIDRPGRSVLLYSFGESAAADLERFPPRFVVVNSVLWSAQISSTSLPQIIGQEVLPLPSAGQSENGPILYDHDDPTGKNGFVLFEKARYDAGIHDRANRAGPIIPVNRDGAEVEDDLVVVWYRRNAATQVAWPVNPLRYQAKWPPNPEKLIIASQLGSGPLDPALFPEMHVYEQSDPTRAGFNPNEEHAFFAPAQGSSLPALFALRSDLGGPATSEPYAILKYRDAATTAWQFRIFQVVAQQAPYFFSSFEATAGTLLQPPYPLSVLRACIESDGTSATANQWFRDYKGSLWARAAGPGQSPATARLRFFYPLQPGFYYDQDGSPGADAEPGECVPWLDRHAGTPGTPMEVPYTVRWPAEVPNLLAGETLTSAKRGLPNILNQAAAEVIFDEKRLPLQSSRGLVKLIDPLSERTVDLARLPAGLSTQDESGKKVLVDLPFHLSLRVSYDPLARKIGFRGHFNAEQAGEPLLLLNVMTEADRSALLGLVASSSPDKVAWDTAIDALFLLTRNPSGIDADGVLGPDDEVWIGFEPNPVTGLARPASLAGVPMALTAGTASAEGFVTLAFNNDPGLDPLPVSLQVIRVSCGPYRGEIKVIESDNVFDERLTLRHSGDFAAEPERFYFEWYYQPDRGGPPPDAPTDSTDLTTNWLLFESGQGLDQVTIGGPGLLTISDNWFFVRYCYDGVFTCPDSSPADDNSRCQRWSGWAGAPGSGQEAVAQLAEGWIKRVVRNLNPFEARVKDFHAAETNTFASMVGQLGARFEGAVALNSDPGNLNGIGLIEAYETVLRRGLDLSIDGSPPVDYAPANNALLLASSRISDFYMLLGNEAMADAADPTIGFGTSSALGTKASSVFSFMNQLDSPLEEELVLLRGRDDTSPADVRPVYNRLYWNFTSDMGEVAYVNSHVVTDQNYDGVIDVKDARVLYPQGHGDAWGHYLTAMTTYYRLLRHPRFTWQARAENVLVSNVPVLVDFLDERKFARAAAARVKAGAEIVDLTYQQSYVEDPSGQWQGYKDADEDRAWGLDGWGRRAGQGAYLDWVVANALLPPVDTDPSHAGIQKIDRTTVLELGEISAEVQAVQAQVDKADSGLNPLGVVQGTVPFDLDPRLVLLQSPLAKTHFEQIQDRAVKSLNNAFVAFNFANEDSQHLRRLQESVEDFIVKTFLQERDYTARLIEIFGYPYSEDIGPGGVYPSGYNGPDLLHFDYVDSSELMRENPLPVMQIKTTVRGFVLDSEGRPAFNEEGEPLVGDSREVTFNLATNGLGLIRPDGWTERRAPGEIQMARSGLLRSLAEFQRALTGYENFLRQIDDEVALLKERKGVNSDEIELLNKQREDLLSLTEHILSLHNSVFILKSIAEIAKLISEAAAEGIPKVLGLANDTLAPIRALIRVTGVIVSAGTNKTAEVLELLQKHEELAKEDVKELTGIQLKTNSNDFEVEQHLRALEQLLRQEAVMRLELFTMQEVLKQASGQYRAVLARGQRLLEERLVFRKLAAVQTQQYRYQDMTFRIFRNDAIQKFRAQFDLAARYVFLAAKAYDYETNLLGSDSRAGRDFLTEIIRQRSLGEVVNGQPISGTPGLANALARMGQNFDVLKGQLGFNNPQTETNQFSLRSQLFRQGSSSDSAWEQTLSGKIVADLWSLPEYRLHCRPFAPETNSSGAHVPQPGLVIRFSTNVTSGLNFFGRPLLAGDSAYDASNFATKVRSVGVWFEEYRETGLASTPRAYLVPAGMDVMRSPTGNNFATREWFVRDQKLPVPFPIGPQAFAQPDFIPRIDTLSEDLGGIRRSSSFRAYHDSGDSDAAIQTETTADSRLIGRSVWNTNWVLIIPGAALLGDANEGVQTFVRGRRTSNNRRDGNGVTDILIFFHTYAYSGN